MIPQRRPRRLAGIAIAAAALLALAPAPSAAWELGFEELAGAGPFSTPLATQYRPSLGVTFAGCDSGRGVFVPPAAAPPITRTGAGRAETVCNNLERPPLIAGTFASPQQAVRLFASPTGDQRLDLELRAFGARGAQVGPTATGNAGYREWVRLAVEAPSRQPEIVSWEVRLGGQAVDDFRLDDMAVPPDTTIVSSSLTGPSFTFGSDQPGVTFQCSVDGSPFAACAAETTLTGIGAGTHVLAVRALDAAGNADPSPASQAWAVDPPVIRPPEAVDTDGDGIPDARPDNCPAAANAGQEDADADAIGDACDEDPRADPPVFRQRVSAVVEEGVVFIRRPGRLAQAESGFVPLRGRTDIPVGSTIDADDGRVEITSATSGSGRQTGVFSQGTFQIAQLRIDARAATEARVRGASFAAACRVKGVVVPLRGRPVGVRPPRRAVPRIGKVARALRAVLGGQYRIAARNAVVTLPRGAATVRVEDRCNATATRVIAGRVSVEDLGRDRTVRLRAGRTYVAPLPRAGRSAAAARLLADAPRNDHYLLSLSPEDPRTDSLPHNVWFTDEVDTTAATDQRDDLFAPPRSGGGDEPTVCAGTVLGKTVWYDLNPDVEGFAEVEATGFDTVVAVYEYSRSTGRLLRGQCFDDAAGVSESALVRLRAGVAYTAQVGGVDAGAGPASGALTVRIRFLADRDGDGRIDRLDECPALAGVRSEGFCPPKVAVSPLYAFQALPGGALRLVRFDVRARVPRRARVELACGRGCSFRLGGTAGRGRAARLVPGPGLRVPEGARPRAAGDGPRPHRPVPALHDPRRADPGVRRALPAARLAAAAGLLHLRRCARSPVSVARQRRLPLRGTG